MGPRIMTKLDKTIAAALIASLILLGAAYLVPALNISLLSMVI